MPTPATGSAFESRGSIFLRVTVAPQKRQAAIMPWMTPELWSKHRAESCVCAACARARAVQGFVTRLRVAGKVSFIEKVVEEGGAAPDAAALAELGAAVDGIVGGHIEPSIAVADGLTFKTFAQRWTSGELHRLYPDHVQKKTSADDDGERLEKYVYPYVQDVSLRAFTRAHADGVMSKLPVHLRPSSRRQIAQVINRVLRLAVFAGEIPHTPLPTGWLPKAQKAETIAKESLLPSEEAQLLGAPEEKVPLCYRQIYFFLHREGMRKGEARKLTRADLNIAKGIVSLDENKTKRPRSWVMAPPVTRMLEKIVANKKPTDLVFDGVDFERLARLYREHCAAAGIERARLFVRKENKLQLRAHDMRAFFTTAAIIAGKDVLWITDRTGHTTLGMVRNYERDARRWRELGEPTPIGLEGIPEYAHAAADAAAGSSQRSRASSRAIAKSRTFLVKSRRARFRFRRRKACGFESRPVHNEGNAIADIPPADSAAASAAASRQPDSFPEELRLLVSELRAVIADLRAENRRLRTELGEQAAPVTDLGAARRRGRR